MEDGDESYERDACTGDDGGSGLVISRLVGRDCTYLPVTHVGAVKSS